MSHFSAKSAKSCTATVLACLLALPGAGFAQQSGAHQASVPVVQPIPQKSAGLRLNDALNSLARNPRDVSALGEAGEASLELGDAQAAIGFYRRALTIEPQNARLKAGLAGAYVLGEDPFTAIELFDEAEKAGPIDPARLSDRGLAFDLVGDSQTAQRYYTQSLAAVPNDETLRRLGLNQAIRRDRKGMDQTLATLLQRQDKAAWRTRAFGLAIMGQADEAEAIARQNMPTAMAEAITAYFRYMPRLTAAQQASAGNLGRFPRASEIGVDDPRVAAYSRSPVQVAAVTPSPAAKPVKGRTSRDNKAAKAPPAKPVIAVPPPEPQVSRETASVATSLGRTGQPVIAASTPDRSTTLPAQPAVVVAERSAVAPAAPQKPALAMNTSVIQETVVVDRSQPSSSPSPAGDPTPASPTEAPPAPRKLVSLDEAFADFAPPSNVIAPKAGAVDVRTVHPVAVPKKTAANTEVSAQEPSAKAVLAKPAAAKAQAVKAQPAKEPLAKGKLAKEEAGKEPLGKEPLGKGKDAKGKLPDPKAQDAKAKDAKAQDAKAKDVRSKPSHPSRIWVQVAAGRNKAALAFDWRKFAKEEPAIFKAQKPYVSEWGQTNRLLTGPFASANQAEAYLAKVKKAGHAGAFLWTSPAGQVVDTLAVGK